MGAWESEAIHINEDTCVDVKTDGSSVVLGQLGAAWMHDLHMPADKAALVGKALIEASAHSLAG